jgi:hypothetical protein
MLDFSLLKSNIKSTISQAQGERLNKSTLPKSSFNCVPTLIWKSKELGRLSGALAPEQLNNLTEKLIQSII